MDIQGPPTGTGTATEKAINVIMNNNGSDDKKKTKEDSTTADKKQISTSDMTRRMVCGGLAGMVAKTATNPLERIKMLSQTGEHGIHHDSSSSSSSTTSRQQHPSVLSMYRNIVQREGILGLWAGNGANLLRVFPAKAVVFSTNDMYKSMLCRVTGTTTQASGPLSFLAGGLAGMTATAITYPLDFARGRISGKLAGAHTSNNSNTPQGGRPIKEYSGITRTIVITIKDEGVMALFKGVTPTMLGALPYEGIKFGTVGLLENLFPASPDQSASYFVTRKMFMGGCGGVMAGLITYPNDTVRRLLQMQGSRGTTSDYSGYWDCVRKTYHQHGIPRFYRGIVINSVRMLPNVAIQFGSYELLKRWTANIF